MAGKLYDGRLHIDLRKKKNSACYLGINRRCGCVCKSCGWRGYRPVVFKVDAKLAFIRQMDVPNKWSDLNRFITNQSLKERTQLRGELSYDHCPRCNEQTVVFTHVP